MAAVNKGGRTLGGDLAALLTSEKFCDVTLIAGETEIPAHRAVLAARSAVFEAMFSHDTLEATSGRIEVPDVGADVLRQLLVFIYTDEAPELHMLVPQLFVAADKYELVALRDKCQQWMSEHLSVDNAASVAVVAVQHSCPALVTSAVGFIKDHIFQVMATKGWNDAVFTQPAAIAEISKLLETTAPQKSLVYEEELRMLNEELLEAAKSGDVVKLRKQLERGAQLEWQDESGWTALHHAARGGYERAVRCLLGKGAQVDVRDKDQQTPLHLASEYGPVNVVRLLVDSSADVNARNSDGSTPLHYVAYNGIVEVITVLLMAGANKDARNDRGHIPVDAMVTGDEYDPAEYLLRNGLVSQEQMNVELLQAAKSGDVEQLNNLLEKGADLEWDDGSGWTVLHYAARDGHDVAVRCLLEKGAQVNARDQLWQTPLHLASEYGPASVVRQLLDVSADVDARNREGWTPLHYAASGGVVEVIRVLLQAGASRDCRDNRGMTPLDLLMVEDEHDVVADLLRNGDQCTA